MKNLNIKAVSQISGIHESTLRAWERRYNLVHPSRSTGGHRLYSLKDVEKLRALWSLVQEGHQIGRLSKLSAAELKVLQNQDTGLRGADENPETANSPSPYLDPVLGHLDRFDLVGISEVLQSARFDLGPRDLLLAFFIPLLGEIGQRVAARRMSVAQEHLISNIVRDELGSLYQRNIPPQSPRRRPLRTVLATREGDLHDLSLLMAAIFCRLHGHETFYLGSNMPSNDLADACREFRADYLVLGLTDLSEGQKAPTPNRFVRQLDKSLPSRVQLLVGGSASSEPLGLSSQRRLVVFSSLEELDSFWERRDLR